MITNDTYAVVGWPELQVRPWRNDSGHWYWCLTVDLAVVAEGVELSPSEAWMAVAAAYEAWEQEHDLGDEYARSAEGMACSSQRS